MQISSYQRVFNEYFAGADYKNDAQKASAVLREARRVFFLGNGGSNAICSHMYEDFAKILRYQTFAFSDAALITCFSNDYGYEKAMAEWLGIYGQAGDVLVAISSSGNSMNIVNAVEKANALGMSAITLSGFKPDNKLRKLGHVNFYIPESDYGIVECFHQVILHAILDDLALERKE
jgi:D-sedoheptulose 7-phosphate isomerase